MRPIIVTLDSVSISDPIVVDNYQDNFKVGLQAAFSAGANATVTVQSTMDDPYADYDTDFNTDATWFDVTGMSALTAGAQGNIFFPVRAIRLNMTARTAGSVTLTVLQPQDK